MQNNTKTDRVIFHFKNICRIPHGSGNTEEISNYCCEFAEKNNLEYYKDGLNNVLIKKSGSAGYEEREAVILQGHLDMVCEKTEDCKTDFLKDGIKILKDGDYIYADKTTLGADNGIGVAIILAVLEDESLCHPSIEALFTSDEETGMYGAAGFDVNLLSGKKLINLDSEEEGVITVGCAGGVRNDAVFSFDRTENTKTAYKISVSGLKGGHSGMEIINRRLNANHVLADFLNLLPGVRIAEISGGEKDNAIPRNSQAIIAFDGDPNEFISDFVKSEVRQSDPDLKVISKKHEKTEIAFSENASKIIIDFIRSVPDGVIQMSKDIEGLVETSLNLGVVKTENDKVFCTFSVRSSLNGQKQKISQIIRKTACDFGGEFESRADYPAWEYKKDSSLLKIMIENFKKLYGTNPTVEIIHAGLECGLFSDRIRGLDAVSFGPDIYNVHTTEEKVSVSSVQRTFDFLKNILSSL